MVNTIDEVKFIFDNGTADMMMDDNWMNSQNVSQYLLGDKDSLFYDNMNKQSVMFNYRQYVDRIQNMHNIKSCKGDFKAVHGQRIWDSFKQAREDSFSIGGFIVKSDNLKAVALIDYLIWHPSANTVLPVIVIPVGYDYWNVNKMKSDMLPELIFYNHLVISNVASDNGLRSIFPIMIIKDKSGKFVSFRMDKYTNLFVNQGDVLEAMKYIRKVIENGITVKTNVMEGRLCMFE